MAAVSEFAITGRSAPPLSLTGPKCFSLHFSRAVYHDTENISYLEPKIWDIVCIELKNTQSLNSFKKSIRKWKPNNCPCRLCKRYVDGVGFL